VNLSPDHRIAGVLTPLFALRTGSDLGIGDIEGLRQFIDWTAKIGFKLVQLLPINETGGDNSPYNAISASAIEPTTLHLAPGVPQDLTEEDFEAAVAAVNLKELRRGDVDYSAVKPLKQKLLWFAFRRFIERQKSDAVAANEFEGFCESEESWLPDYALFRMLMQKHGHEKWDEWPAEHRTIELARKWLQKLSGTERTRLDESQTFFKYVQWVAHHQWSEIKKHAEARGVALMGDIPFGISFYSADVFARPDQFALNWSGGAPPEPYFKDDEFTQKWGQNWGIPVYRWDTMRQQGFGWWRQRVRGVKRIFHAFRIDHVLGFYRIYAFPWRPQRNEEFLPLSYEEMKERTGGREPHFVPRDDSTPANCDQNQKEGEEYLRVVLAESGATRVVGEDLGTVPPYVRPNLHSLGIAGFKIPQWEVRDNDVVPGNEYERLSVATYATHDHKPIRAIWDEAFDENSPTRDQARDDLRKIARFAGVESLADPNAYLEFYPAIMRALFASNAWIAVYMITDLLARTERFNVPGTASESNWSWRLHRTVGGLSKDRTIAQEMRSVRELLKETGRWQTRTTAD
jgi:4-alpha-glucanotransferase